MPTHRESRLNGDGSAKPDRAVPLLTVPDDFQFRTVTLPPVPRAVHRARTWVRETLAKRQLTHRGEDAELAASELATNAIRHAQDGASVSLTLMYAAATLRLEVRDHDPMHAPLVRNPGPMDTSGWGPLLVSECADRWDVRISETGKTVWCEFTTTSPRPRWLSLDAVEEGGQIDD